MNVVGARMRLGLSAAAAAGAFVLALVPVTAAQAAGPEQFRLTVPISMTDTTTCGFPIAVNVQDRLVGRVFFDAQGNIGEHKPRAEHRRDRECERYHASHE